MRRLFVLILLLVPGWVFPPASEPANRKTDVVYDVQDPVSIKTRDGASISAIVVRKKQETKALPVILFYTTYVFGPDDASIAKKSVDKGYVGIIAYSRGIRTNLADYVPYEHDGRDIYDVIEWITKQPWCDGKVAMYGGSYTGYSQWATAKALHPALKTIVPQAAVMPGYDTPIENNVCASFLCFSWPNDVLQNKPLPQDLFPRWFAAGASYRSLDAFADQPNRIFQKWMQHPAYDDYWQSMIPSAQEFARIKIPVLTTTGYYDGAQIGAIKYFKLHYQYNQAADHYLVIGPYSHRGAQRNATPTLMGYQLDAGAVLNLEDVVFQWFDYVLRGGKRPEILKAKVNFEVMGADEWMHVPFLSAMSDEVLRFYLSEAKSGDDRLLTPQKPTPLNFLNQTVDYSDRQTQNNYFTPVIINDSLTAGNGLTFVSAPFTEAFCINGAFSGEIEAAINKRDVDISMALYELMPNGKYFYLTRYLGRASYAKDKSRRQLLQPGRKESIPIGDTRIVSKLISRGSRLVIVLNVNKHPFEIVNYGSGKDVNDETIKDAGEPLQIKWYNDSYVDLPIFRIKK